MKKTIHIVYVNPGRFVKPFANSINELGFDNQFFLPIGTNTKRKDFSASVPNTVDIGYPSKKAPIHVFNFLRKLSMTIDAYDTIIWHSLFFQKVIFAYMVLFHKDIIRKSIWLVWGGDIYCWHSKSKVLDFFYKKFVSYLKAIIVDFPPDESVVRREFQFEEKVFYAGYENYIGPFDYINKAMDEKRTHSNLRVMIGHSAVPEMKHNEILDILAKFKYEDIKIILPLNYGSVEYAKNVKLHARKIFSEEKIEFLESNMSLEEYISYLKEVDIGIFNTDRQMALGNIYPLLYMGKTLYLDKNGTMYKYFEDNGMFIRNIEDLKNSSFDQLKNDTSLRNFSFLEHYYDKNTFISEWNEILNY